MATTAPATSIRFTNNEFDFVIDNAKRDPEVYSMMDQFNDAELDYLKGRIRTRTPPKGATAARGQQRLARLQAGTMQQATQPPQEEGLLGKAFGHVPDYGAATQDIMAMRQQQEMQGTMLPPQFQAQQVQEMGGGPGLQTALNVVPGAANILLGTGEMLRHLGEQAKGTTLEMAGKAKQVAETLLPDDFIKKASALASAAGYAATGSAESFLGMLSGKDVEEAGSKMAGEANLKSMRMVEAIIGQTSNIIYEAANEVSWDTPVVATVMSKMGADPPRLAEYVQHDPVGTALALLPFIKVAHGARTFEPHQWKVVEAELRRGRQPGDATTPAEVFERANMFEENRSAAQSAIDAIIPAEETITSTEAPQFGPSTVPMSLTEQARGTLGSRLEQASRPKEAGTFSNVMDALLAEAELVMPDMSRRQLRDLARQHSATSESGHPNVGWLVDIIASARAARGQTNTPITTPMRPFENAKLARLRELGDQVERFWREEVAAGDEAAQLTGHEMYRRAREKATQETPAGKLGEVTATEAAPLELQVFDNLEAAQAEAARIAKELGCG